MDAFSFQNVIDGNGIGITIIGMAVVFAGLAFISLFISQLANMLDLMDKITKKKVSSSTSQHKTEEGNTGIAGDEDEIMSLLGLVIHMELEAISGADIQKITISNDQRSLWGSAGKMRSLPRRRQDA
ncbi:MAG: OadG family protein [SAR324 cluster bacterium]|nr:OadG family protein [SAR324 cluster bacterium]